MSKMTKARKGDLIVVETIDRTYFIGQPYTETTQYNVGVVASATREGEVKTWAAVGWGDDLISTDSAGRWVGRPMLPGQRRWVMTQKTIDVQAALRVVKAHHWPNQPMAFDSLDAVKAAVRPHLLVEVRA